MHAVEDVFRSSELLCGGRGLPGVLHGWVGRSIRLDLYVCQGPQALVVVGLQHSPHPWLRRAALKT